MRRVRMVAVRRVRMVAVRRVGVRIVRVRKVPVIVNVRVVRMVDVHWRVAVPTEELAAAGCAHAVRAAGVAFGVGVGGSGGGGLLGC